VANIGRTGDKMRLLVVPGSHVVVSKNRNLRGIIPECGQKTFFIALSL